MVVRRNATRVPRDEGHAQTQMELRLPSPHYHNAGSISEERMFEPLFRYAQINDLQDQSTFAKAHLSARDRRALVPIGVIDDEAFSPEANLRANGYDIHVIGDVRDLSQVEPYNIVLCDLQGVGRLLDKKGQGAFLISEIKRNHPEKFVIAYTGGSPDADVTLRAQEFSDYFLRKDADIDDWRDRLDGVIDILSDPVEVWRRQRYALIEAEVPTLQILRLEDAYVRSVIQRSDSKYREIANRPGMNKDLRAIAQSLAASGIFKLLVG